MPGSVSRCRSHVFRRLGERGADRLCFVGELAGRAQQPFAFRHRLADESAALVLASLAVSPIRVCAPALACCRALIMLASVVFAEFARFAQLLGFAQEVCGELRRAGRRIRHDELEMALGIAGHGFEFLRFAAQRFDRMFHRGAFLRQRLFEQGAFVL